MRFLCQICTLTIMHEAFAHYLRGWDYYWVRIIYIAFKVTTSFTKLIKMCLLSSFLPLISFSLLPVMCQLIDKYCFLHSWRYPIAFLGKCKNHIKLPTFWGPLIIRPDHLCLFAIRCSEAFQKYWTHIMAREPATEDLPNEEGPYLNITLPSQDFAVWQTRLADLTRQAPRNTG